MTDLAARIARYQAAVREARSFADGATGPIWNGLYLMGLTLAGLTLIPTDSMVDRKLYWVFAPLPNKDPDNPDHVDWGPSWLVEQDAFATPTEVPDDGYAHLQRGSPEDWTGAGHGPDRPVPGEPEPTGSGDGHPRPRRRAV